MEQDPEKVAAYKEAVSRVPEGSIVYVDETGIDTFLYREYCYAPRGKKVFGAVKGHKYKRVGIVAGLIGGKSVAPLEYDGTMDSVLFEQWAGEHLLPSVPRGTTIVMDNAAFHRKKRLAAIVDAAGCNLLFLPPYSPELNPIEKYWSWMKRELRNILPLHSSFDDALSYVFQVR